VLPKEGSGGAAAGSPLSVLAPRERHLALLGDVGLIGGPELAVVTAPVLVVAKQLRVDAARPLATLPAGYRRAERLVVTPGMSAACPERVCAPVNGWTLTRSSRPRRCWPGPSVSQVPGTTLYFWPTTAGSSYKIEKAS